MRMRWNHGASNVSVFLNAGFEDEDGSLIRIQDVNEVMAVGIGERSL